MDFLENDMETDAARGPASSALPGTPQHLLEKDKSRRDKKKSPLPTITCL
jgi:hypothetical protein